MSKTKLYTKSKHPNQGLIDCFLRQAKTEEEYANYCAEQRLYNLADEAQLRRRIWLEAARLTQELS
jgi:hydroxyacyl-ACP dehydratase HTD2-like protein with hotdog domain